MDHTARIGDQCADAGPRVMASFADVGRPVHVDNAVDGRILLPYANVTPILAARSTYDA